MEISDRDLHRYIRIYNDFLPKNLLNNLLRICKTSSKFTKASIIRAKSDDNVDENIRKTQTWALSPKNKSLTDVHWFNFLARKFNDAILDYENFYDFDGRGFRIDDIQILKYVEGGHYKFHIDNGPTAHRTFSGILFLNDDFDGGDLLFKYPYSKEIVKIPKKQNIFIVWPSNFLFPHKVTPVTKGERYSVVTWAV